MRSRRKRSMAGTRVKRREKMSPEMLHIFVVIQVFHHISSCVGSVESSGQAFIQTDNELRFMGEMPIHFMPGQNIEDISLQDDLGASKSILFDPPLLDFKEQPLGMPHMERVIIHNAHTKNRLQLLSISGSTLHFHCSFFQDKYVPPGGNTTFEVVFLARQVGNVENTLYIHTSQGSYKYQVFGVGVANPYRVRPFLGARVPLNSSFSPLIHMHNPHGSTLQVEEIYTSGGDLHLELPTGETEATKDFWAIPPYQTKPIMKASFIGRIENNHTSFIRIKTNKENKDQVLILPVEVEVTSVPGIYSTLELMDFGIVRTFDEPRTLQLKLVNSGDYPVHISEVVVEPPNSAIHIDFRPIHLKPDILQPTTVASISYTVSKSSPTETMGKIIVKTKSGAYRLMIPYQAAVLHGSVAYDQNKTLFYTGYPRYQNISRDLPITNAFNFVLMIHNATVPKEMEDFFTITRFKKPIKLAPGETSKVVWLHFHPNASHLHFTTTLNLQTNASNIAIPLYVYNGKLKVVHHRPEIFKGQLDFGTLGTEETRSMTFTLRNDNPLDVNVRDYSCNMKSTTVEFLGLEKGNGTMLTHAHNVSNISTNPLVIKPHHFAVFSVNLKAPPNEGTFAAEVIISTQFDVGNLPVSSSAYLYIPMTLRTAEGSLIPNPPKLLYESCFPGKVSVSELYLHSSFIHFMEVRDISFSPNDTRFYYVPPKNTKSVLLEPDKQNLIGSIYFDMKRACKDDCYIGLPTYIPAGHHWLLGSTLDRDVADTDQYLYTRFQEKWQQLHYKQSRTINVTMNLDTNQVRGFLFPAQAHLEWPSLVSPKHIQFPLTQIGNSSVAEVILENPAHMSVMIQVLPLSLYPHPQTILDMLAPSLKADLNAIIEADSLNVFTLEDLEKYQDNPHNLVPVLRKQIENTLGVRPHPDTLSMILTGGSKMRITLGFVPLDDQPRTSLIIIRNNLTIIDTIVVQGQGGRGEIRFNNKKAGSQTPLQFDFTDKYLKNCDTTKKQRQSKSLPPNFTLRRTFTAKNTGQLPFYVQGFSINGVACEGFGFKVTDCTGFELMPDESRKIDIAFTPDFTMSRVRRVLVLHTSLGSSINYTLQATLPPYMLTRCAAALPRPAWEALLFYASVGVMALMACCVVVTAYFEADRIYTADIIQLRVMQFDKNKVFDLSRVKPSGDGGGGGTVASNGHGVGNGVVKITKTETTQNNNNVNADILCNGNHHVVEKLSPKAVVVNGKKKDSGKMGILRAFMKKIMGSRSTHIKRAETPESVNSDDRIVTNGGCKTASSITENSAAASIETVSAAASATTTSAATATASDEQPKQQQPAAAPLFIRLSKKPKGAKRPYSSEPSYRAGDKSAASKGSKKSSMTHDKNNTNVTETGEPSLSSIKAQLDKVSEEDIFPAANTKGKSSGRKVPSSRSRSNKSDHRVVSCPPPIAQHQVSADKDDTSSTTTESSLDVDDKTSSARDSTPEPQPPKKKVRSKTLHGGAGKKHHMTSMTSEPITNPSGGSGTGGVAEDDEFMVTSKSKAHKKIRVDPKDAYGGNILRPSTYELPYTTKLENAESKKLEAAAAMITQDLNMAAAAAKKAMASKRNKIPKGIKRPSSSSSSEYSAAENSTLLMENSKPSMSGLSSFGGGLWDSPMPANPADDLIELSVQTEQFSRNMLSQAPPAPPSSSSSSSYSSVLGGGQQLQTHGGSNTGPSLMLSSKAPGAPPSRPSPAGSVSPPQAPGSMTPWSTEPPPPSSSLGLDAISLGAAPPTTFPMDPAPGGLSTAAAALAAAATAGGAFSAGSSMFTNTVASSAQQQSIMQRLLAERRNRQIEYQQKLISRNEEWEWPGFGPLPSGPAPTPAQPESLWDDEPWAPPSSLWSSSSGWNPPSSIWPSGTPGDSVSDIGNTPAPTASTAGTYDPFGSGIWNPNTSPWAFQPPRPDDDDVMADAGKQDQKQE